MNGIGSVWKAGICLATDASLIERLKSFFLSKDMREAGPLCDSYPENNCLMFSGNNIISAVRILEEDELSSRNSVLEAVLSTASLMNRVNHVYLALPKLVSSTIESNIIEEHGIGLVVYDQKTVEEVVVPKYLQIANQGSTMTVANGESHQALIEEIGALRGRLKFLEEAIESLKSEVAYLRSWKPSATHVGAVTSLPITPVFEGAPSFIKDNPWIDVLSKRGRENDRLVS